MISAGLDESAATLTLIRGIGPKLAKRLQLAGMTDIEELASAEPDDLLTIKGLSRQRIEKWIAEAVGLIRSRSAFSYRETGPLVSLSPPGWPPAVNPYRLRRALDLKIIGAEGGTYRITGGLEPHTVRTESGRLVCDCHDFIKAASHEYECKHVLAVRLRKGDRQLRLLARQLSNTDSDAKLNLFDLWFDSRSPANERRIA